MLSIALTASITDLDPKTGLFTGYLAKWEEPDVEGNFFIRGSTFVKTVAEHGPAGSGKIHHMLNAANKTRLGVFLKIWENPTGLAYSSNLIRSRPAQYAPHSAKIIEYYGNGFTFSHACSIQPIKQQKSTHGVVIQEARIFAGITLCAPIAVL